MPALAPAPKGFHLVEEALPPPPKGFHLVEDTVLPVEQPQPAPVQLQPAPTQPQPTTSQQGRVLDPEQWALGGYQDQFFSDPTVPSREGMIPAAAEPQPPSTIERTYLDPERSVWEKAAVAKGLTSYPKVYDISTGRYLPLPTTPEEHDALPDGVFFMGADSSVYTKEGNKDKRAVLPDPHPDVLRADIKHVFEDEAIPLPDGRMAKPTEYDRLRAGRAITKLPEVQHGAPSVISDVMLSTVATRNTWMMAMGTEAIQAANRIKDGEKTRENYATVAVFFEEGRKLAEKYDQMPWYQKVSDGVLQTLEWGSAIVSGRSPAKLVRGVITKGTPGVASRAVGEVAGEAARLLVTPGLQRMAAEKTVEKMAPDAIGFDGLEEGDPFVESLAKAETSQLISLLVERTGLRLFQLPGMKRFKGAVARAAGREPEAIRTAAEWNGILGEFTEERLEDIAQGVFDWAVGDQADFGATGDVLSGDPERVERGLKAMAVEGAVLGIVGGPAQISDLIDKIKTRMSEGGKGPSRKEAAALGITGEQARTEQGRREGLESIEKEAQDASKIREDERQVQKGRAVEPSGEEEGGADLQSAAEARPEARDEEVPREEVAEETYAETKQRIAEARARGDVTMREVDQGTQAYRGTGGIASEAKGSGFQVAFRDNETGEVAIPMTDLGTAGITPAGVHVFDGLPDNFVTERNKHGDPIAVKGSVEAGFIKDGKFYTRDEAAAVVSSAPKTPTDAPKPKLGAKPVPKPKAPPAAAQEPEKVVPAQQKTEPTKPPPKVGEYVQWTSQGIDRFPESRKITGVSEDGTYVFVEGTTTGIPAAEVVVVDKAKEREQEELRKLREQSSREVKDWARRVKRHGGRVAKPTFAGLQGAVNEALDLLGLKGSDDLSPEGIKKAYRAASMKAHPDRGGSQGKIKAVTRARELLEAAPATLDLARRKFEREHPLAKPKSAQPTTPTEPETIPKAVSVAEKPLEGAPTRSRADFEAMTKAQLAEFIGMDTGWKGKKKDALIDMAMENQAEKSAAPGKPESQRPAEELVETKPVPWEVLPDDIKNLSDEDLRSLVNSLRGVKPGRKGAVPKKITRDEMLTEAAESLGLIGKKPSVTRFEKLKPKQPTEEVPSGEPEQRTMESDRPPLSELGATGSNAGLVTSKGKSKQVQYVAVEASEIIPSHDARNAFTRIEGSHPNERPYHDPKEGAESRQTVLNIAKVDDPDKLTLLTSDVREANSGPPITTDTGVVLGGNGRSMGIQLAYHNGGAPAGRMKQAMVDAAAKFGIDISAVESMSQPVIVRVLDNPGDLRTISALLNEALTAAKSQATVAVSQGQRVTDDTASTIAKMLEPQGVEDNPTLREVLAKPAKAERIVQMLKENGAWSEREVALYVDATTGTLNADGRSAVEQLLIGKLIADPSIVGEAIPGARQKLIAAIGPLTRGMADKTHGARIAQAIKEAVQAFNGYKAESITLEQYFMQQKGLFDVPGEGDYAVAGIVHALDKLGPIKFKNAMAGIVRAMDIGSAPKSLFEEDNQTVDTLEEAVELEINPPLKPPGPPKRRIGARKKRPGKPLTRAAVQQIFPGAKITQAPRGWHVEIGDSFFTIQFTDEMPAINWDAAERAAGSQIPVSLRELIQSAGETSLTFPDGTKHNGLGLILLNESLADDIVLRHEALHLARQADIIGQSEWDALVKAHARGATNEDVQEERVAQAMEAVETETRLWSRIKSWLRRLFAGLGITDYQVRDVHQLLRSSGFWERARKSPQERARYALRGRPDLANPATEEEARRVVDDVDEARNQRGLPRRRADEDVEREANERLERDYEGERDKLVQAGRDGEQLLDTDTIIAKKVINREASEAIQSGDSQRIADAMTIIEAYRNTGSEQGRAFRQRQDPVETPAERMARAISEAILEPPQKERERRNRARRKGRHAEADRINAKWAEELKKLKEKLKTLGVDLDNLWEPGYSRKRAATILAAIEHTKASRPDKLYEYWRNSILSLPTTQVANLIGNIGHAGWHFTAERFTEAVVNTVTLTPEAAQWGEFKHMLAGMLPGMSEGARNFLTTWNTETPTFEATIGREGLWRIEDPHTAIGGALGRGVRWPQRLLLAVDDFAKTMFTRMEVGVHAYRIAKAEGLSKKALARRVQALTLDEASPAWDPAYDSALALAFQQKGGENLQKVKRNVLAVRRDLPGIRYLIPFVTTPANIFATGIKKSPLGAFRALGLPMKMYQNYQEDRHVLDGVVRPAEIAQQMLAWGLVLALMGNDEDDPWITGAEPQSTHKKREVGYRTAPAMSVKIGDKWYSYSRLEPFATAIGLTVDFINAMRSGDTERQVEVPLTSLRGQLGSKTFLSGVGDILDAAQSPKVSQGIARWASNFSTSWVPNIVRGAGREASDYYENRRVWGTRSEWFKRLGKRTLQKTELSLFQEHPIYDAWGRPARRSETGLGPTTDWLYRITVPIRIQEDKTFNADRLILNYNLQNAEDELLPLAPLPYYRRDGKTHYLTDGQYAELTRLSGETARETLDETHFDVDNPTIEAVEWINKAAAEARGEVRDRLIEQWGGKDVEIEPSALGKEIRQDMKQSLAHSVPHVEPKHKPKMTDEEHAELVERFKEKQIKIKRTLDVLGVTHDQAQELLTESFWKLKDGKISTELKETGGARKEYLVKGNALAKLYGKGDEGFQEWWNKYTEGEKSTPRSRDLDEWMAKQK